MTTNANKAGQANGGDALIAGYQSMAARADRLVDLLDGWQGKRGVSSERARQAYNTAAAIEGEWLLDPDLQALQPGGVDQEEWEEWHAEPEPPSSSYWVELVSDLIKREHHQS